MRRAWLVSTPQSYVDLGNVVLVSAEADLPVEQLDRRARAARFPAAVSVGL